MTFPCTSCGACCRRVGEFAEIFPEPVRSDGVCTHLGEDNRCMIYDRRPLVCRVDELREAMAKDIPVGEWYRRNAEACNQMQEEDQLDPEYRVKT